jgi:UDP-N-acetylmuramate dehydrogenase
MSSAVSSVLPKVRGSLTEQASLAELIWFRTGGAADYLFEPADADDLAHFLQQCPRDMPIYPLGLGSNLIVRDGGVRGVVVRLGKAFSHVEITGAYIMCGGGTPGILAASQARDHALAGLEFLRGIPGTIGGAVKMNAGAYGRDIAAILDFADIITRDGKRMRLSARELSFTYRHSSLAADSIVVAAQFSGVAGDKAAITAEMDRIAAEREASQPLRTRTGGSTFKNPQDEKAWALVDKAGCRGLRVGGAMVSEKHTNFLLNTGTATSADIEALGEDVRARVLAMFGIQLEWEIQRIGVSA